MAKAVVASESPGIKTFKIAGYERAPFNGHRPFNIDGSLKDADGMAIMIILFHDQNHRLLELEIYRADGERLINPQWDTLSLY